MTIIVNQVAVPVSGKSFLDLVNLMKFECGVTGADLLTLSGQSGEMLNLIRWINSAWIDIQSKRQDWPWMRRSCSFTTTAGKAIYSQTDCNISDLGTWDRNTFRNYLTVVGQRSEIYMGYTPYESWRNQYQYGNMRFTQTRPIEVTVTPDFSLGLGPVPLDGYTITGDYYRIPSELIEDSDIPSIPTQFQLAIVYRAMMSYGGMEAASEVYQRGETEFKIIMNRMGVNRLPEMTIGSALA